MTTVILWRHAATPYNDEQRLQGHLDIGLEAQGREQAHRAAARILEAYGEPVSLWTSPLSRSLHTATALADLSGLDARVHEGLTQRSYGIWEGMTWDEVARIYPEQYSARRRNDDPDIEGWETAPDVARRVGTALREIAEHPGVHVIVSHGSSIGLGMAHLLELDLYTESLGRVRHARWVDLRSRTDGGWQIRALNCGVD